MKGNYLLGSGQSFYEPNIYAKKSSLVVYWLLTEGIERPHFSIREVAKNCQLSLGLVQRIFETLLFLGILKSEGVRTSKRFILSKPKALLEQWSTHYNLIKKCKLHTYRLGVSSKSEAYKLLKHSNLGEKIALALHSAAEEHHCKNTNLQTIELYLLDPKIRKKLENLLSLEPQERGYEILLIEPYYINILTLHTISNKIQISPILLTYLDLLHFPLRGKEQADYMASKSPLLKKIYAARSRKRR